MPHPQNGRVELLLFAQSRVWGWIRPLLLKFYRKDSGVPAVEWDLNIPYSHMNQVQIANSDFRRLVVLDDEIMSLW